ncbi:MAG: hypothetical protein IIW65_06080 [Alistipes sp.]|nr:hypothetical protein [Alistipes sp.]
MKRNNIYFQFYKFQENAISQQIATRCKNSIFSTNTTFLHSFSAKPPLKITPYPNFTTHFTANDTKTTPHFTKFTISTNLQFNSVIDNISTIYPLRRSAPDTKHSSTITKLTNKRAHSSITLFIKGIAL